MSLFSLIIFLVIIGVILWLINNYVPMDAKIKQLLNYAVVIIIVLWLLFKLLLPHVHDIKI